MIYKAKVTKEFIDHRNTLAAALHKKEYWIKDRHPFLLRADHEMPEWHTPEFKTLKEAFGLDAVHEKHGVTDFKHIHRPSGNASISLWAQKQEFDNYVFWDWTLNDKYFDKLPLETGDEVSWEIIDIVPKSSVEKAIVNQTQYNYNDHVNLR